MNAFDELDILLAHVEVKPADAIVLLAGDRFHRIPKVAELFHNQYGPVVVITSNADDWGYGSAPSRKLIPELERAGIPREIIVAEETAPHTRAEANATFRIAKEKGWRSIIIVTTRYHRVRAFLTWLKAMRDADLSLTFVFACVDEFPEFSQGREKEILQGEQERIRLYQEKGDVASWEEGFSALQDMIG